MMRKESGSNSLTFFVACLRDSPRPSLPAGRDFGPVRTCGAFPPTAARRAPHRSRSHGRLRRPKSLPIRHSPAAAQCLTPLGWRDCLVLASWLHRFASLGLKSRIDAVIALVFTSWLHRFASLGLKSGINARIALVLTSLLHQFASLGLKSRIDARFAPVLTFCLHRFASLGPKSRITAAPSCRQVELPAYSIRCRYVAASDSNFLRRKVEQFRLRKVVTATMPRPIPIFVAAK